MDIQFKKIISLFFAAVSICICVIFTSCSDTMVELPTLYPRVIYSYSSEEKVPDAVLSVFSEVSSEAVRLSSMTVQHNASGLSWFVQPVSVVQDSKKKQYAGSANLKMPDGQEFPEGIYTIIFRDYAGNTNVSTFTLEKTMRDTIPERPESHKKYIVYDKEGCILYISSDTNDTSDTIDRLSRKYNDAYSMREYISDIRKKAVYILPSEPAGIENE